MIRNGDYEAVYARGEMREHMCAFVRKRDERRVLVAAPRFPARLTWGRAFPSGRRVWGEEEPRSRDGAPARCWNVFSGEEIEAAGGMMKLAEMFARWPVAMLWGKSYNRLAEYCTS